VTIAVLTDLVDGFMPIISWVIVDAPAVAGSDLPLGCLSATASGI
jgi:hypothetical protein